MYADEGAQPALYGLPKQARCLAAVVAETSRSLFLAGTLGVKEDNEIHLVEYSEDRAEIVCEAQIDHASEIWNIAPSPHKVDVLATSSANGSSHVANVHKLPVLAGSGGSSALEGMAETTPYEEDIQRLVWHPNIEGELMVVTESKVSMWNFADGGAKESASLDLGSRPRLFHGSYSPHHEAHVATANDTHVKEWDTRTGKTTFEIQHAHKDLVRCIDYNPNKPYHIVSAGDDGNIRFWDIRHSKDSLSTLAAHSHWIFSINFNQLYDQLLLTCSSDMNVKLWSVLSVSSGASSLDESVGKADSDRCIKAFEEHEDSVYSVTWSAADPWTFASLSYDGRIVVNQVPSQEKYKILL